MTTVEVSLDLTDRRARNALRAMLAEFDDELDREERPSGALWPVGRWTPVAVEPCAAAGVPPQASAAGEELPPTESHSGSDAEAERPQEPPAEAPAEEPEGPEPDWPALIARVLAGEDRKAVAAEAGISRMRLHGKVMAEQNRLRRMDEAREAPAPVAAAPEPAPVAAAPEPAPVAAAPEPAQPSDPDLPDPDGWTLREDLTILRRYGQGENSYRIAQKLPGRSAADVVGRFRRLVPRPGISAQREALARLERLVHGAAKPVAAE